MCTKILLLSGPGERAQGTGRLRDVRAKREVTRGVGDPAREGNPEGRNAGLGSQLSIEVWNATSAEGQRDGLSKPGHLEQLALL
jgi:hypothetical protein